MNATSTNTLSGTEIRQSRFHRSRSASGIVARLVASIRRSHRRRAAISELARMPSWRLADLGLERQQIPVVVDRMLAAQETSNANVRDSGSKSVTVGDVSRSDLSACNA